MTPLQIEVLLHCATSGSPFPRADAPAVVEAIKYFLNNYLIEGSDDYYTTTDRGEALVNLLCQVSFPVKGWVDKDGKLVGERYPKEEYE